MLPSGVTVIEDDESSSTRAPGSVFCAGSTPGVEPRRQPPGVPLAGSSAPGNVPESSLHPSWRRSRSDVHYLGVRSALTAAIPPYRLIPSSKYVRVTVRHASIHLLVRLRAPAQHRRSFRGGDYSEAMDKESLCALTVQIAVIISGYLLRLHPLE